GEADHGGAGRPDAPGTGAQPPGLLVYGDGWSRAVLESGALRRNRGAGLAGLLTLSAGTRPTMDKGWGAAVNLLGSAEKSTAPVLRALLRALATAPPSALHPDGASDTRPILVSRENTVAAVNTLWAASHVLGPEAVPDLGEALGRLLEEPWIAESTGIRDAGAGALAAIATEEAFEQLKAVVPKAQTKTQRELLLLAISRMPWAARAAGTAEVAVATHGLDVSGKRSLTTHHRSYTLALNVNGAVTSSRLDDDTVVTDEAAERVLRTEIRAINATYRKELARIEALLATECTWSPAQWRQLYLGHPITRAVASRLVWRLELESGETLDAIPAWQPAGLLRELPHIAGGPSGPGTPIPENVRSVQLWHPREAAPEELAVWRGILRRLSIRDHFDQPFQQIERAFTSAAREPEQTELRQWAGAVADAESWQATLAELRWSRVTKSGGKAADREDLIHREFPQDKVTATALVTRISAAASPGGKSGANPGSNTSANPAARTQIRFGTAWIHRTDDKALTPLPWSALHPRLCSEVERDLSLLMSPPSDAAAMLLGTGPVGPAGPVDAPGTPADAPINPSHPHVTPDILP
ncbi:DUF4132 domain-containing protein, partial [Actinospica durhamensis]